MIGYMTSVVEFLPYKNVAIYCCLYVGEKLATSHYGKSPQTYNKLNLLLLSTWKSSI